MADGCVVCGTDFLVTNTHCGRCNLAAQPGALPREIPHQYCRQISEAHLVRLKDELKRRFEGAKLPTDVIDSAFLFFAGIPATARPTEGSPQFWWTFCTKCGYHTPVHTPPNHVAISKEQLEVLARVTATVRFKSECGTVTEEHGAVVGDCAKCDAAHEAYRADLKAHKDALAESPSIIASLKAKLL